MALIPLFEAKTYLRVDSSDEDVLVGVLLSSAEQLCVEVARLTQEQWKAIDALACDEEGNILPTDTELYTEEELSASAMSCVWRCCMLLDTFMSTGRRQTTTP